MPASTKRYVRGFVLAAVVLLSLGLARDAFAQGSWTTKTPMPEAQNGVSATVVNSLIYVIGGFGNVNFAYNPLSDTWATKTSMPSTVRSRQRNCGSQRRHLSRWRQCQWLLYECEPGV